MKRIIVVVFALLSFALCVLFAASAVASKSKITGIYSNMYQSKETHDISGMELLIVKCTDNDEYYGFVQIAEGSPQIPFVVKLKIEGNKIEFEDKPSTYEKREPMKFKGVIYDKGIKGEWLGGFGVDMKRGKSFWQ